MATITRKVQLVLDVEDKDQRSVFWGKLFGWQRICHKAANWIITHQYMLENLKDFIYLTDGVKVKLENIDKDEDGILTTSKLNATYQLLSNKFKGECPMGMLGALNMFVCKRYSTDSFKIKTGEISLSTFRDSIPMPINSADTRNWSKIKEGDYKGNFTFSVYGVPFQTYFGVDKSKNELIFNKAFITNEYKFCGSSICFERDKKKKLKIFLLATFSFENEKTIIDPQKEIVCELSVQNPIIIKEPKRDYYIGTQEEYLHGRLAISNARKRLQGAAKYNAGGKGRKKKLASLDRLAEKEKDYVDTKMHYYSRKLIDYCIKNGVGKIILSNLKDVEDECKGDKLLFPSWSYGNLVGKIVYKAAIHGIEVIIPETEKKTKSNTKNEE